jgi:2,3-bisphosphoglycerate-dependent phosphoglycerate mutase
LEQRNICRTGQSLKKETMTQEIHITFMRHGRSLADDENKFEGRYDSPLTEIGREQASERALKWQADAVRFDRIISSPLVRASETAEIVGEILGTPVETDPDWMEMDNRPLAGLTYEEGKVQYPPPAFRNPYEPFHGVGESDWEIYCRAARAVEKVVRRGPGSTLVVAHGGILNMALRTIAGAAPPVNRTGIWFGLSDTGYARTLYYPDKHQWVIVELRA